MWPWLKTGRKVQGLLGGNFHSRKFEKALISRQTQRQFNTLDVTQAFAEIC